MQQSLTKTALVIFLGVLGTTRLLAAVAQVGNELGCVSGNCVNGVGTLVEKLDDGLRRYRGEFKNGHYDGFGKLEFLRQRITYKGNFKKGMRWGRGTQWDEKKSVFIGQWRGDKRNGKGVQAFHVEEWKEDKYTENWLEKNTENYSGEFLNDNFDGQGTYRWPDGVRYTGGWVANKKHGRGYFLYTTGLRSDRIYNFDERVYDEPLPR
jgi:hypothetical protein